MAEHIPVSPTALFSLALDILRALGLKEDKAGIVADTLVEADLQGVATHGIVRLTAYAARVFSGGLNPRAEIDIVRESATSAVLDANNSFGQVAAYRASEMAFEKAAQKGLGMVSVRNSNHFGRAGYYSEWIARRGMIGIAMSNASPRLAPWGGKKPLLGNNPWSIALPTGGNPLVLDMANSIAAAGKLREMAQQGAALPEGWALDSGGRPTTDPVAALQGVLLPFGTYKGYGITLMAGILTGILAGGGWDDQVRPVDVTDQPQRESHLIAAIRIDDFLPVGSFKEKVDEVIGKIKACPPSENSSGVFFPGEIEHEKRKRNLQEGIPLVGSTFEKLEALARRLGVDAPTGWPDSRV